MGDQTEHPYQQDVDQPFRFYEDGDPFVSSPKGRGRIAITGGD
jgi:hypothetical protein